MGNKMIDKAVNPFIQIAGARALAWGALGLLVSTVICYYAGYHYHGLLHFGPAPNPAWWCYAAEHLIVWLIPALLFYLGGKMFSHSRIRAIDVLGTVLFAELPLLGMTLIYLTQSFILPAVILSLLGIPFLLLTLVWLFNALKVSCNLKGWHLWAVVLVGILGGDVLCRMLISHLYG